MRLWRLSLLALGLAFPGFGCSGGGDSAPQLQQAPDDSPAPAPLPFPRPIAQQPPVDAEVFGVQGQPVDGMDATYVSTELGWIAPDGSVVFEAVIQWSADRNNLACGIFRRAPDGQVNALLLQDQRLPAGEPGTIIHPQLPLESGAATLLLPADIVDGSYLHGLFAVPVGGGAPTLLAGDNDGRFVGATITAEGSVLAEVSRPGGRRVLLIEAGKDPRVLCDHCEPGLSTDGTCAVVRHDDAAWMIEFDGNQMRLGGIGDDAPHGNGTIIGVRGAWINDAGAFVLHLDSDAEEHPDMLVRIEASGDPVEVLAACGADAPGIEGTVEQIHVADGRGEDVVFAARLVHNGTAGAAVFCARPGEHPVPLVASGDVIDGVRIAVLTPHVVVDRSGSVAFGAAIYDSAGLPAAEGVFRTPPGELPQRVLSTDARIPSADGALLQGFIYPLRQAIDVDATGRTLVHVGLVEDRRPDATLGALLLVR